MIDFKSTVGASGSLSDPDVLSARLEISRPIVIFAYSYFSEKVFGTGKFGTNVASVSLSDSDVLSLSLGISFHGSARINYGCRIINVISC